MTRPCGKPTANGPCRRPVTAGGAPCGVTHSTPVLPAEAPSPPATPVPDSDPFGGDDRGVAGQVDAGSASRDPATPPDELDRLAASPGWVIRANVAGNPGARADTLVHLAADPVPAVRDNVARNRSLSEAAAAVLSSDDDNGVRTLGLLAENPAAPASILAVLAGRPVHGILFRLAGNPSCPAHVLAALAGRPAFAARVAANRSTPPEVLAQLAGHADPAVRAEVAANPAASAADRAHTGLLAG